MNGIMQADFVLRMVLVALSVWTGATVLKAVEPGPDLDSAVEEQVRYAEALIELELPEYAELVMQRIKDPGAQMHLQVLRFRGLIAQGRFDEARTLIERDSDSDSQTTWVRKLALADGYYSRGRYSEARKLYNSFLAAFPGGPPDALKAFFVESIYKYAQMLLMVGDREGSIDVYGRLLDTELERHVRRQLLSEMTELQLKLADETEGARRAELLEAVRANTTELLWVQDLWFGKAIVMRSHMELLEGDIPGAQALIREYREQLESIDRTLADQAEDSDEDLLKLSPMAQCRYLLGVMMQEEAERLIAENGERDRILALLAGSKDAEGNRAGGALQHFLNVFIRYPFTAWAPDAGVRARQVENTLRKRYGAEITTQVTPEQMEKVKEAQFQEAAALFRNRQFKDAASSYRRVLNLFPEGRPAVRALGELARCYIELGDDIYATMVTGFLAERFGFGDVLMVEAGNQLLRIRDLYRERQRPDRAGHTLALFFDAFREHPRAPAILFSEGERRVVDEDFAGALEQYGKLVSAYTNSPLYTKALNRMAYCHHEQNDPAAEAESLERLVTALGEQARPGHLLVNARYRLASAYRRLGGTALARAVREYDALQNLLDGDRTGLQRTAEEAETNEEIYRGAQFYKALCLASLEGPEEKLTAYRQAAIREFERLVERFPRSEFAPLALSQVGTLWTVLGDADKARRTLQRLRDQYPDAPQARNASFMLGKNLLKLGMKRRAVDVFEEMLGNAATYSAAQILTVGNEMLTAGDPDLARRAFEQVIERAETRAKREAAMLGLSKALVEQDRLQDAAPILEKMLSENPRSGYTVEAYYTLSRIYRTLAADEPGDDDRFERFNKAVRALKEVRRFEASPAGNARSDLAVARVYVDKAKAEERFGDKKRAERIVREAIAAYQTLILLGRVGDPDVRPYIEEAYHECVPLLMKIERWKNAEEDSERYLREFPTGHYVVELRNARNEARLRRMTQTPGPGEQDGTM